MEPLDYSTMPPVKLCIHEIFAQRNINEAYVQSVIDLFNASKEPLEAIRMLPVTRVVIEAYGRFLNEIDDEPDRIRLAHCLGQYLEGCGKVRYRKKPNHDSAM